jgi:uncharacterized membrane protein YgcG
MAIPRILVVALAVFFECLTPQEAPSGELPRLSGMVNDFPSSLQVPYVKDLEVRLRRFNERSGYAIIVVVIARGEDEQISDLISRLFVNNGLEKWGLAGTVLVLITVEEGWVIAEPSQKLEGKFLEPRALERINHFFNGEFNNREVAVERRVQEVLKILDPWLYVLDPPSTNLNLVLARSPTAEIILFPMAPFLGFMTGVMLMAFTSAGELRACGRFLVCGFLGCFVAVITAFLVRQPGGIAPGMLYYSAGLSFVVSALIGGLRPFWFTDKVRGRKAGEKMHPPFFGRG